MDGSGSATPVEQTPVTPAALAAVAPASKREQVIIPYRTEGGTAFKRLNLLSMPNGMGDVSKPGARLHRFNTHVA